MGLYARLVFPILSRLDAEVVHDRTLDLLDLAARRPIGRSLLDRLFRFEDTRLEVDCFSLHFSNPVGLAAGFDKDGKAPSGLARLGFGHIEVGTVTPHPQRGNERPRIHRLTEDRALVNWMGFPNRGAAGIASVLANVGHRSWTMGVNVGKGSQTPLSEASADYCRGIRAFYPHADYIAVNVSSPNTPELRRLQGASFLDAFISEVVQCNLDAARVNSMKPRPLLVKIAPDLELGEIDHILDVLLARNIDGIIAGNTTVKRDGLASKNPPPQGGLSGLPLRKISTEIVRHVYERSQGKLPIIGVGGIFSAADVLEKVQAGATLVQLYTGLVYQGPFVVKRIKKDLVAHLERVGVPSIRDLVGAKACSPNPAGLRNDCQQQV